jgi:hypothetical protein
MSQGKAVIETQHKISREMMAALKGRAKLRAVAQSRHTDTAASWAAVLFARAARHEARTRSRRAVARTPARKDSRHAV